VASYFNTTDLRGDQLQKERGQASRQEDMILAFFRRHPDELFTPSDVWRRMFLAKGVPITSVRRAITCLTNRGELLKTGKKRDGLYGKPEHFWTRK
jgi:hypothetical protein